MPGDLDRLQLTLDEERFLAVLRALDGGAQSAQHGPRALQIRRLRSRLIAEWGIARTRNAQRSVVAVGAVLGRALGVRNAKPVLPEDVLVQRLGEAIAAVDADLPVSDTYPTGQAGDIYHGVVDLWGDVLRMIEANIQVGDTNQWTDTLLGIIRDYWSHWDATMQPYRNAVLTAEKAGTTEVTFADAKFKPTMLEALRQIAVALDKLDQANKDKGILNAETKVGEALVVANRILHGVGREIKDLAIGAVDTTGRAVRGVVSAFGVKDALIWGAVAVGGGFVLVRLLGKK